MKQTIDIVADVLSDKLDKTKLPLNRNVAIGLAWELETLREAQRIIKKYEK